MASHDDIDQLFRQIGGVPEGYREFGVPASKAIVAVEPEAATAPSLQAQRPDLPSLTPLEAVPLPVPVPAAASPIPASATPLASLFDRLARAAGPSRAQGAH